MFKLQVGEFRYKRGFYRASHPVDKLAMMAETELKGEVKIMRETDKAILVTVQYTEERIFRKYGKDGYAVSTRPIFYRNQFYSVWVPRSALKIIGAELLIQEWVINQPNTEMADCDDNILQVVEEQVAI